MKNLILFLLFSLCTTSAFAVKNLTNVAKSEVGTHVSGLHPDILSMSVNDFINMTPKQYKQITGKRMGIKNALKMKVAQRQFKKMGNADISEGLYVVMAIFGLGWLAMGLLSDWEDDDWIINLILTVLCWLPGLIHALVKKENYY